MPIFTDRPLLIEPRFSEILNAEFSPITDPEHRRHKAIRLAQACIEKGTNPDPRERTWHYSPSWAPGTRAETRLRGGIGTHEITSLTVSTPDRDSFVRVEELEMGLAARATGLLRVEGVLEQLDAEFDLHSYRELDEAADILGSHLEMFYAQFTK